MGEQGEMCGEMKGAQGWAPGDVLGPSAKWDATRAVTSNSKHSGCRVGRGDKDSAGQEVSREQQCFHDGTVLPAGGG